MAQTRRVSILLNSDLDKKIRLEQARLIRKKRSTVSFSHLVNSLLENGLKNGIENYA